MRQDVIKWAKGTPTRKIVSKEYPNHRGLIELVSDLDVYQHTAEAYKRAYQALGIDLINRVPLENAPEPTPEGETRRHPTKPYNYAALGVYDSVMRHTYPCATPEDVWDLDVEALRYEDLLTPVAHAPRADDIKAREEAIGEVGWFWIFTSEPGIVPVLVSAAAVRCRATSHCRISRPTLMRGRRLVQRRKTGELVVVGDRKEVL